MKVLSLTLALMFLFSLVACAGRESGNRLGTPVSMQSYASYDCEQLATERERIMGLDTFEAEYQQRQDNLRQSGFQFQSSGASLFGAPNYRGPVVDTRPARHQYRIAYQAVQRVAAEKHCPDANPPALYWQMRERLREMPR